MANSKRRYIVIGLIAIIVVYALYSIFLSYASYANDIPRKVRHINRLLCIIVIYGIGYFSFKKVGIKWVVDTWNIVYFTIAFLLILTGVYDWLLGPSPLGLRAIAKNLNEFLISPLPFVALFAISNVVNKVSPSTQKQ